MTSVIPILPEPAQNLRVQLGQQQCVIALYQRWGRLYLDLMVDNVQIMRARLCRDRVGLVRDAYLGFAGQLAFVDTQGTSDPEYTGLGSRYILIYTA